MLRLIIFINFKTVQITSITTIKYLLNRCLCFRMTEHNIVPYSTDIDFKRLRFAHLFNSFIQNNQQFNYLFFICTYGQLIKDYLFIDLSEQYAYIISKDTNSILRLRANNGDFVDHFRL